MSDEIASSHGGISSNETRKSATAAVEPVPAALTSRMRSF